MSFGGDDALRRVNLIALIGDGGVSERKYGDHGDRVCYEVDPINLFLLHSTAHAASKPTGTDTRRTAGIEPNRHTSRVFDPISDKVSNAAAYAVAYTMNRTDS